jgi:hypothetical protein
VNLAHVCQRFREDVFELIELQVTERTSESVREGKMLKKHGYLHGKQLRQVEYRWQRASQSVVSQVTANNILLGRARAIKFLYLQSLHLGETVNGSGDSTRKVIVGQNTTNEI